MRVASFDVSNSSHSCPSGLELVTNIKRRCVMPSDGAGCASTMYDVHGIPYQRVCGKVIGYQEGSTDGLGNSRHSIEGAYVDGVSLTHGHSPRHHIWTFVSAIDESDHHSRTGSLCSCTHGLGSSAGIMGDDYSCDTGSREPFEYGRLYHEDPLWDGEGCGGSSTCCSFNNPPWFMKTLFSLTSDDLELRVCI